MELQFGVVVCVRKIDVGRTIDDGVAAAAAAAAADDDDDTDDGTIMGGGGAGGNCVAAIDTGKNVDVLRSDVVDEFGDNGLRWYK